ncbi:hypothetical protein PR048_024689 [Dryococelus australis]|uniref:Ig-like domain-containing protein n=1 Tax=Dryococelus australis TaxID=614101 RepID=A0ABQ9GPB2_9NEOP|nr:hypothetical protein PR048_024689 [Dryococelus australis]
MGCVAANWHVLSVLLVKPLTVRILSKQSPLVADKRYEVTCESAGSRPPAVITWYKGKRQLKRVKVSLDTSRRRLPASGTRSRIRD